MARAIETGPEPVTERSPAPATRDQRAASTVRDRWAQTRPLLWLLSLREFRTRYRQSVLDVAWSFISPVVIMVVYGIILHSSFKVSGQGVPYLTFAWTGLVMWTFFSASVGTATGSMLGAADLISKVYFPREAVPLSMVGASLVDLVIGFVTVVLLGLVQGVRPAMSNVVVVLPLLLLVVYAAAIGMIGAALTVFIRDVDHAVRLILQVGFFATPVMYAPEVLPQRVSLDGVGEPCRGLHRCGSETPCSAGCGRTGGCSPSTRRSPSGWCWGRSSTRRSSSPGWSMSSEVSSREDLADGELRVRDLTKHYAPAGTLQGARAASPRSMRPPIGEPSVALDHVDIHVEPGSALGIIGPNGGRQVDLAEDPGRRGGSHQRHHRARWPPRPPDRAGCGVPR